MTIPSIPECLILSGLPACGKSSRAAAWLAEDPTHRRRVNYDQLRIDDGRPWSRSMEQDIKAQARTLAIDAFTAGHSVVIDNTNLTQHIRASWTDLARHCGATVVYEEIDTPVQECVRRDKLRVGAGWNESSRVGRAIIERMALLHGYIDWADMRPKRSEKDIIICDIDGTIADCTHRLHHIKNGGHNWKAFHQEVGGDTPITPVIDLIHSLCADYHIILVSGRSPDHGCAEATEDWLDLHIGGCYAHLFMRPNLNSEPDDKVKQDILELLPKERIAFVLDDRPRVIRMWRKNCLKVLDCGEGVEF